MLICWAFIYTYCFILICFNQRLPKLILANICENFTILNYFLYFLSQLEFPFYSGNTNNRPPPLVRLIAPHRIPDNRVRPDCVLLGAANSIYAFAWPLNIREFWCTLAILIGIIILFVSVQSRNKCIQKPFNYFQE